MSSFLDDILFTPELPACECVGPGDPDTVPRIRVDVIPSSAACDPAVIVKLTMVRGMFGATLGRAPERGAVITLYARQDIPPGPISRDLAVLADALRTAADRIEQHLRERGKAEP